jgi:AcrR family transcriptional regulator
MELSEKIVQTAGKLFLRYGIRAVTMDEIARHLSVSKKTIYQFFTDKDHIVTAFCRQHTNEENRRVCEISEKAPNVLHEMIQMNDYIRNQVFAIHPSVLIDLRKYHPQAWEIFHNFQRGYVYEHICDVIRRGVDQGYFRSELNVEILATMRMQQLEMGFDPDIFPSDRFNFGEVQLQMLEHFFFGLLTAKGMDEYIKLKKDRADRLGS